MTRLRRWRALVGIAVALLRHERTRTILAVAGVTTAVLAAILLASVGFGVIETGEHKFDQSGRDIWVSGGPVEIQPGSVGGFENPLIGAHELQAEIEAREDIDNAAPFVFQTVYISSDGTDVSDFETILGVGNVAAGPSVNIIEGRQFEGGDQHYGNGSYNEPMTREVLIDEDIKKRYGLSIGETVYLGGTIATARDNKFTVVGVTDTYSQFLGTSAVVMQPSELQQIAGLTASDRAAMLTVSLAEDARVNQTVTELEREYPEYTVRTNQEQLRSILADQAVIITSGASLVLLAVIAGVLLLTNLQLSFISRHRETFGALSALGTTQSSLVLIILINTMCIGILGGALGGLLAVPGIWAMNWVAVTLTGFENVVPVSGQILLAGFGVSVVVSLIGGVVATLYLARIKALAHLR